MFQVASHLTRSNSVVHDLLSGFADFMPDDTADHRTTDCATGTAARKDGTRDTTDSRTGRRVLALSRHPAATA